MPDRLKPSESVLGMKEMRDMHAKTAGPTLSVAKGAKAVAGLLGKALGLAVRTLDTIQKLCSCRLHRMRLHAPDLEIDSHIFRISAGVIWWRCVYVQQEEEPVVDISKLKANGFYVRQADSIWQHLKKSEDDSMDFQGRHAELGCTRVPLPASFLT